MRVMGVGILFKYVYVILDIYRYLCMVYLDMIIYFIVVYKIRFMYFCIFLKLQVCLEDKLYRMQMYINICIYVVR